MDEGYQVRIGAIDTFCSGKEKLVVTTTQGNNNHANAGSPPGYNDFGNYLNNITADDNDDESVSSLDDHDVNDVTSSPPSATTTNTVLTVREGTQWGAVMGSVLFCPRWIKLQFTSSGSSTVSYSTLLISRLGFSAQYGTQYQYSTSPREEQQYKKFENRNSEQLQFNPKHQTSLFSLVYQSSAAMQVLATDVALFLGSGVTLIGFAIPQLALLFRILNGSLNISCDEQQQQHPPLSIGVLGRFGGFATRGYKFVVQEVLMPYPRELLLLANSSNHDDTSASSTTISNSTLKIVAATLMLGVVIPLIRSQMSSRLIPFIVRSVGHRIIDYNWKYMTTSSPNSSKTGGWLSTQVRKVRLVSLVIMKSNGQAAENDTRGVDSADERKSTKTTRWDDIYRQVLQHHIALYCTPWSAQELNLGGRRNFGDVKSTPWWCVDVPRSLTTCRLTKINEGEQIDSSRIDKTPHIASSAKESLSHFHCILCPLPCCRCR
jgi:hypothetical protein